MLKNFSLNWVLFSLTRNKLSQIGFLFSHLGNTFSHIEFYFHGWEKYPLIGLCFLGPTQYFHKWEKITGEIKSQVGKKDIWENMGKIKKIWEILGKDGNFFSQKNSDF